MTSDAVLLAGLREIVTQPASQTALRVLVFMFGILGALAWDRRRPVLALATVSLGGLLGLSYWLIQIVSPLGFGTDPSKTREWAQAGINAAAGPGASGFVWGTEPEVSLVSSLAAAGVPISVVSLVPQIAVLLALGLLVVLPFGLTKNRSTAALAAIFALGGGLAPGLAPYGSILIRPSALLVATALAGFLVLAAHEPRARRTFHGAWWTISGLCIAAAALDRALEGAGAPGAAGPLLMSGAAIPLTSPLRAALRLVLTSPTRARRAEATLLVCVFGGSGVLWWDPPGSVAGFNAARDQNAALLRPMGWISRNVPPGNVVLASPAYSAPIAAFAGRRVLFPPLADVSAQASLPEPFRRARLAETTRRGRPVARLAESFSVTHLFLGPGEPSPATGAPESTSGEARLVLVLEYQDAKDFRVFRFAKK